VGVGLGCKLETVAVSTGSTVGTGAPEPKQPNGTQVKAKTAKRQTLGI
jgi:hypothetical protein